MESRGTKTKKSRSFFKSRAWKILRPIIIIVVSLLVVFVLFFSLKDYFQEKYFAPVDESSTDIVEVTIPKNSSLSAISDILEENGLIRSKVFFKLYADFSDMSYKLKAGTYNLSPAMTYDDIVYTLMKGMPPAKEVSFTFIEGITTEGEANQLADTENGGILESPDRFLELAKDGAKFSNYSFIQDVIDKNDGRNYVLDGYLFPDTYRFYSDAAEEDIITKQLDRFNQIFTPDYIIRAEELGMSVDDVVILASIIEKEAITSDFAKVSAVFHNRLDEGMPLGSCATMQVVTGEKKYTFTDEELAIDSPYNTYKYTGLPVGPICNPGLEAIKAALYPDEEYVEEGYLYFCLTDPETGEQVFAKTYDEHQKNVATWESYWQ